MNPFRSATTKSYKPVPKVVEEHIVHTYLNEENDTQQTGISVNNARLAFRPLRKNEKRTGEQRAFLALYSLNIIFLAGIVVVAGFLYAIQSECNILYDASEIDTFTGAVITKGTAFLDIGWCGTKQTTNAPNVPTAPSIPVPTPSAGPTTTYVYDGTNAHEYSLIRNLMIASILASIVCCVLSCIKGCIVKTSYKKDKWYGDYYRTLGSLLFIVIVWKVIVLWSEVDHCMWALQNTDNARSGTPANTNTKFPCLKGVGVLDQAELDTNFRSLGHNSFLASDALTVLVFLGLIIIGSCGGGA
ncbi:MAG: hypothetical protein ACTSUE_23675 [Promethearchaeota archaeon]